MCLREVHQQKACNDREKKLPQVHKKSDMLFAMLCTVLVHRIVETAVEREEKTTKSFPAAEKKGIFLKYFREYWKKSHRSSARQHANTDLKVRRGLLQQIHMAKNGS
jgi:hypothetical protein